MRVTPSPLVLILVGSAITTIFSGLLVQEEPILVGIIPITILAAFIYGTETGIMVGVSTAFLSGILTGRIEGWEIIVYALGAGIGGYLAGTYAPKKDNFYFLVFIGFATIINELFLNALIGKTPILTEFDFLGSSAIAGLRLMLNIAQGIAFAGIWVPESKDKKN